MPYKTKSRSIYTSGTENEVSDAPFYPSFDLDLPAECDDEYWSPQNPEDAFKQPQGKPSKLSYFIAYLKLSQILAFALRTIVSSATSCHVGIGLPMTT